MADDEEDDDDEEEEEEDGMDFLTGCAQDATLSQDFGSPEVQQPDFRTCALFATSAGCVLFCHVV